MKSGGSGNSDVAGDRKGRPYDAVLDFDFKHSDRISRWLGHAPQGRGALLIIIII